MFELVLLPQRFPDAEDPAVYEVFSRIYSGIGFLLECPPDCKRNPLPATIVPVQIPSPALPHFHQLPWDQFDVPLLPHLSRAPLVFLYFPDSEYLIIAMHPCM